MTLVAFRQQLVRTGQACQLLEVQSRLIRFRFIGAFAGEDVIWDVSLRALGRDAPAQYIDISEAEGDVRPVAVGLLLDELDSPCIEKTMLMIRRYKRLRAGRHDYLGPAKVGKE